MFNYFLYLRQNGYMAIFRYVYFKLIKNVFKKKIIKFRTIYNTNFNIFNWDDQGSSLFIKKYFTEWGIEHFFLHTLKERERNTFLDIGCHAGYFASLYKNFFNKIIGFEPSIKCQNALSLLKKECKNFIYYTRFMGNVEKEVISDQYENGFAYFSQSKTHNLFKNSKNKKLK